MFVICNMSINLVKCAPEVPVSPQVVKSGMQQSVMSEKNVQLKPGDIEIPPSLDPPSSGGVYVSDRSYPFRHDTGLGADGHLFSYRICLEQGGGQCRHIHVMDIIWLSTHWSTLAQLGLSMPIRISMLCLLTQCLQHWKMRAAVATMANIDIKTELLAQNFWSLVCSVLSCTPGLPKLSARSPSNCVIQCLLNEMREVPFYPEF